MFFISAQPPSEIHQTRLLSYARQIVLAMVCYLIDHRIELENIQEKFENTTGVIRSRIPKKNRSYNGKEEQRQQ